MRDLFTFQLNYNNPLTATALFNGNISETQWRTASDNKLRKYDYAYDHLNRLMNANYSRPDGYSTTNSYGENLTYDKNGNIKTLSRFGDFDDNITALQIDNLSYVYKQNSNQLTKVTDFTNSKSGFKDDSDGTNDPVDDYSYDANGNMTADENKKIQCIQYNHLNLPTAILFVDGNKINYLYNAVGIKIQKSVIAQTIFVSTEYHSGFQYRQGTLQLFPHAEGYVSAAAGVFNYVYNYTDHLGNVRLSYGLNPANVLTIFEENNYYPFGLRHSNYNMSARMYYRTGAGNIVFGSQPIVTNNLTYNYKYNGKELQDELGLNVTAMDYRQYDNAIGRFNSIDALAELMPSITPFHFGYNNPAFWADPSGLLSQAFLDGIWNNSGSGRTDWYNSGSSFSSNNVGGGKAGSVDNESGTFTGSEALSEVTIKKNSRGDASYVGQLQTHVYTSGKYYQQFRDDYRTGQFNDLQSGLDIIGAIDPTGVVDGLNAATYLARGQNGNAAIAAIAILPLGDLAKLIKIQKHHIIPKAVFRDASDALKKAIDLNGGFNLKKLPTPFHGNHPQYNIFVTNQLNAIENVTSGSIQTLQKNLSGMINQAYDNYKVTGQNLNDYFRQINGN